MNLKDSWLAKLPITHRGLHDKNNPENSMGSFQNSIKFGLPIELDVHITKDGKVVVFHDYNTERMTGKDMLIEEANYREIESLKLSGTEFSIPLFKDVLRLVDGKVPILIEIKNEGKAGVLEGKTLELLNGYKGEYAVQSFNPLSLGWFYKNAPHILRGQLSGDFRGENLAFYKKILLRNCLLNPVSKPNFVNYGIDSLSCLPVKWQQLKDTLLKGKLLKDTLLIGWTARSQAEYEEAISNGCDNAVFEGFVPEQVLSKINPHHFDKDASCSNVDPYKKARLAFVIGKDHRVASGQKKLSQIELVELKEKWNETKEVIGDNFIEEKKERLLKLAYLLEKADVKGLGTLTHTEVCEIEMLAKKCSNRSSIGGTISTGGITVLHCIKTFPKYLENQIKEKNKSKGTKLDRKCK